MHRAIIITIIALVIITVATVVAVVLLKPKANTPIPINTTTTNTTTTSPTLQPPPSQSNTTTVTPVPKPQKPTLPPPPLPPFGIVTIAPNISIYLPRIETTPDTCLTSLGGTALNESYCSWTGSYKPWNTRQAFATSYQCSNGNIQCPFILGDPTPVFTAAQQYSIGKIGPLGSITASTIFGYVALPPMMIGNYRGTASNANPNSFTSNPIISSNQGTTSISTLCYDVQGVNGARAILIAGYRCAGDCFTDISGTTCTNSSNQLLNDCSLCAENSANTIQPGPPCIGSVGDLYPSCYGNGPYCTGPNQGNGDPCEWCSSQNHPHFAIVDSNNINRPVLTQICGFDDAANGVCQLNFVQPFQCLNVPILVQCPAGSYSGQGLGSFLLANGQSCVCLNGLTFTGTQCTK